MNFDKLTQALKGGSGSGNHGHAGRPGKRGGSSVASIASLTQQYADFDKIVRRARLNIAENNLPSGMVAYDTGNNKLNLMDTDTWLDGNMQKKYSKVVTIYSKRIEDA